MCEHGLGAGIAGWRTPARGTGSRLQTCSPSDRCPQAPHLQKSHWGASLDSHKVQDSSVVLSIVKVSSSFSVMAAGWSFQNLGGGVGVPDPTPSSQITWPWRSSLQMARNSSAEHTLALSSCGKPLVTLPWSTRTSGPRDLRGKENQTQELSERPGQLPSRNVCTCICECTCTCTCIWAIHIYMHMFMYIFLNGQDICLTKPRNLSGNQKNLEHVLARVAGRQRCCVRSTLYKHFEWGYTLTC